MEGRSGHLCAMLGCLYKGQGQHDGWSPALSLATFKVVAMLGPGANGLSPVQRYGIEIESRLPLSQRGSSAEMAESYGLNSSTRLEFPITAACKAQLQTTGRLNLVVTTGSQDLAVDSLALVWSDASSGQSKERKGECFAVVFDGPGAPCDPGELVLTPLDAIYLARLCAELERKGPKGPRDQAKASLAGPSSKKSFPENSMAPGISLGFIWLFAGSRADNAPK